MAFQPIVSMYQAKNNTTGLADVKAQVYKNGTPVAVGASAIALTQLDSTNAPGIYILSISSSTLVTLGFASGDTLEVEIDSASHSAPAPFKSIITSFTTDNVYSQVTAVETTLGTPVGASLSADIADIKSDTGAVKTDIESGPYSLQTILQNVQVLQNATNQNGVGYVIPDLLIPSTGSNSYKVPITILNAEGVLVDPTSNVVTVGLTNAAGTDRGSYLVGSSGTPATVAATRVSTGQYYAMLSIASSDPQENLLFSFAYSSSGNPYVRYGQSQTVVDTNAQGYALQSTLLTTQTTVNAIQTEVTNGTYGLSAIESLLSNGTYGLSAIETDLAALQSDVTSNVEGTGFSSSNDSLHAISQYQQTYLFTGGRAV